MDGSRLFAPNILQKLHKTEAALPDLTKNQPSNRDRLGTDRDRDDETEFQYLNHHEIPAFNGSRK
jgi:hypothetical protein